MVEPLFPIYALFLLKLEQGSEEDNFSLDNSFAIFLVFQEKLHSLHKCLANATQIKECSSLNVEDSICFSTKFGKMDFMELKIEFEKNSYKYQFFRKEKLFLNQLFPNINWK